jgi:hypothetical protein
MQTNNSFSSTRFMMLIKQSLIINKSMIGISLAGLTGSLFVVLLFLQRVSNFIYWDNQKYMSFFLVFFIFLGMIYSSLSFPAFRSKEKSIAYLLIPASRSEKFIFEFMIRIVIFVLLIPAIFWLVANLEGAIVHNFVERFTNYRFSFVVAITEIIKKQNLDAWGMYALILLYLFILIANFTGASHFTGSTLIKTLFTISAIICGYILLIFLLFKGLNLKQYDPTTPGILFPKDNKEFITIFALGATVVNLTLIAIAWFRFKEREA